ncbi:FAD-dependent monooxygenase [Dactylosporangium sp. NPDC050688]|uniref:FAD-dependent monooxygenase n=1 Tax=Dactylosporangium sp. NPDC050688 TaxID=3157217 RepID=UPI0033EC7739
MRPASVDVDVLVVGAGPVGLLLAGELRRGGVDVLVVDRLAEPRTESRASTLSARTMELLDERGLVPSLGDPPREPAGHFGGIPLDLSAQPSRYAGQWKVPQPVLERILADAAERAGARVQRGHELVGLTQTGDTVHARLTGASGAVTVRAAYVAGCDGEDSTVRRLAGIAFTGPAAEHRILRADLRGVQLPRRRFELLPGGLAISARSPDGVTRIMVAETGADADVARPATFEEIALVWKRVTGEDVSGAEPLWVNAFGDASRQAERYRERRVLLAGDAAHQQLPAGGQALNLGLQDAVNLGWKLAAQLRGDAPAGLLDTYHAERHPAGRRVLANVQAQARLLFDGNRPSGARELMAELIEQPTVRDLLAAGISGLDVCYARGPHPLVGRRAPELPARQTGLPTTTTRMLRSGRGLLLDLGGAGGWLRAAWQGWDHRVEFGTAEPTPAYDGAAAVLVRPDGIVAWAGADSAGLREALGTWFGSAVEHRPAGSNGTPAAPARIRTAPPTPTRLPATAWSG